jgi:tRNA nucleotidyltransferase/poly(A) polymerase
MFKRRSLKSIISPQDLLAVEAERLRHEAAKMPAGIRQSQLLRRARQAQTASQLDEWLNSRGLRSPE